MTSQTDTDKNQDQTKLENLLFSDPEIKKLLIKGESINIKEMAARLTENGVTIETQGGPAKPQDKANEQEKEKEKEEQAPVNLTNPPKPKSKPKPKPTPKPIRVLPPIQRRYPKDLPPLSPFTIPGARAYLSTGSIDLLASEEENEFVEMAPSAKRSRLTGPSFMTGRSVFD
ncbi:hypothetical protein I302_107711 [Kwoniella bestiolae CBS 10118]|uniref:Uncharacterized protein n=1 Tax=Kwoniella bestiolae CBS 10118 TaxID=1296100 RepID=A0A1B9FXS6_9TREE|nr:hypothetical protein I302_06550 [Kwoniella bestiolae CBS 10118]OCF23567.1 hypothetical protein I302_06550 [Kwoniella bestiolae CBS 10118]